MTTKKKQTKAKDEQLELAAETDIVAEPRGVAIQRADDVSIIERLATDPNVDVDKFERFMAMQERVAAKAAESAFIHDFLLMQAELPEVKRSATGHNNKYAPNEDIQRAIRPVLHKFGFALTFRRGDSGATKIIETIGVLSHRDGHARETSFAAPADEGGSKNIVQAAGSTESYGHRYVTRALLNLITHDMDDDGASSEAPEPPEEYEDWLLGLEAVAAEQGTKALQKYWKESDKMNQSYLTKWNLAGWEKVKATAAAVTS